MDPGVSNFTAEKYASQSLVKGEGNPASYALPLSEIFTVIYLLSS